MRKTIFILALALSACQTEQTTVSTADDGALFEAARKSVLASLRDPKSAEFGPRFQRRQSMGLEVVCGTVNSKNGFGGYTGQTVFVYKIAANRVVFAGDVDQSDPLRPALTLCS